MVSLEEMKQYLRVDFDDDDALISSLITSGIKLCQSVARVENQREINKYEEELKTAVLYTVAYLYENRENADHKALTLMIRSLLFGIRKAEF